MNKPKLKINFTDFWINFNKQDNFFWHLLSRHYEPEISGQPDVLFFSVFGEEYKKYNCLRIFFTGELYEPKLYNADLSISFSRTTDPRNYRFPLFALYFDVRQLLNKPAAETIFKQKKKFCCFVVSNKNCRIRNQFFHRLSKYKKVDSGGKYLNNIGGPVIDKMGFISQYKFVISFENTSYPGYLTEKIMEPMHVSSVPVYWGDPGVYKDFNARSFINVHDYDSIDQAIDQIIRLDTDDELFKAMLSEPWFPDNKINRHYLWDSLLKKIVDLIESRNSIDIAANHSETTLENLLDKTKRKLRGERNFKN